jgi:hypothetical protein
VTAADYSELGWLLITVVAITVLVPLVAVAAIQASPLRTTQQRGSRWHVADIHPRDMPSGLDAPTV